MDVAHRLGPPLRCANVAFHRTKSLSPEAPSSTGLPEILLGDVYYGPGIDVWSIGCILAEVLVPSIGVLFQGGERREMLALIIQMLGRPSEQELWFVSDNNAREFIQSLPPRPIETLSRRLSVGSPPLSAVSTPYPLLGTPHPPNYHRSLCCLPAAQLDPEVIDI